MESKLIPVLNSDIYTYMGCNCIQMDGRVCTSLEINLDCGLQDPDSYGFKFPFSWVIHAADITAFLEQGSQKQGVK